MVVDLDVYKFPTFKCLQPPDFDQPAGTDGQLANIGTWFGLVERSFALGPCVDINHLRVRECQHIKKSSPEASLSVGSSMQCLVDQSVINKPSLLYEIPDPLGVSRKNERHVICYRSSVEVNILSFKGIYMVLNAAILTR
ncbi:unnamed protein product [Fasciola hepatica]|uniref:Uncharacterized protein n=1 Tax=Fasciola hepatica TaxID=6192 RepID=A0ABC9HJE5_FASHE